MPPVDSNDRSAVDLLQLLGVICLACDFCMMPALAAIPGAPALAVPLLMAIVGCVLAQGCLLAAWLAWGDQPFWPRLAGHWIMAALLFLAWAAGFGISHPSELAPVSAFVGLAVPLVSLAAQLPLWIVRQLLGWRLVRSSPEDDAADAPLTIRDLMAATLLVGLALALSRVAPSPDGQEQGIIPLVMCSAAGGVSAITLLPAAAMLLRVERLQRGLWLASLYAAFWVTLLWSVVLVGWHYGLFRVPPWPIVLGAACLIVSYAATVMLAATAARARGYRLAWGRHCSLHAPRGEPNPRDASITPGQV